MRTLTILENAEVISAWPIPDQRERPLLMCRIYLDSCTYMDNFMSSATHQLEFIENAQPDFRQKTIIICSFKFLKILRFQRLYKFLRRKSFHSSLYHILVKTAFAAWAKTSSYLSTQSHCLHSKQIQ